MKVERRIHKGWQEYQDNPKLQEIMRKCMFGKWQYMCSSEKGDISLVQLPDYYMNDGYDWEIWSHETLFEDVQRFKTKKEAMEKIKEYLE